VIPRGCGVWGDGESGDLLDRVQVSVTLGKCVFWEMIHSLMTTVGNVHFKIAKRKTLNLFNHIKISMWSAEYISYLHLVIPVYTYIQTYYTP
jgi:hypothetical protein